MYGDDFSIDISSILDWFLENDRDALRGLLEEQEFRDDVLSYLLNARNVCPECMSNVNVIYEKQLMGEKQENNYENVAMGFECPNCSFKYLVN